MITIKNDFFSHSQSSRQNLNEIEFCIETTVKFIENDLCLNDALLEGYLPFLLKQSAHQLTQILHEMGDNTFDYPAPVSSAIHLNNFFIETILYQMNYLKKSHPLALLIWIVILFRISKLIYSNLFGEMADYFLLHWKKIALDFGVSNWKEISMYQSCLSSHLVDSTRELSH